MCLKTYELDSAHFYHYQDHHGKKKKTEIKNKQTKKKKQVRNRIRIINGF